MAGVLTLCPTVAWLQTPGARGFLARASPSGKRGVRAHDSSPGAACGHASALRTNILYLHGIDSIRILLFNV